MSAAADEAYSGKNVLITGGLGFVGSNLAHRLVDAGAHVLLVDSLIDDYGGNLFNIDDIQDRVRVNIADIRDQHGMNYLVRGQDYIFNLAGQVSHIDSMRDPHTDLDINCRAQLSLLEACRVNNPTVKLVYASTTQIYGAPASLPVTELHLRKPIDVNGINTMAGEGYHILYNNIYGLRACAIRMTRTYGPRMLVRHSRQTALGWFVRQALDDEEITIFDGRQVRDYTYIDDAIEAFMLAGASDAANGEVFNLGGAEPVNLIELVDTLVRAAGSGRYRIVPFPEERRRIDIGDFYADYAKIESALGWRPTIALEDGLSRSTAYYRKHRNQYWSRA
ncbi:MAG: NAD-dependent epimerase/dehydratase family protein [Dehalococcoidia bacterium]|nr:NAD-dependent epimerase/dehydratase family protein [Dehalococcoidia bacterium]